MTTHGAQSFLLRVLRRMETRLRDGQRHIESEIVGKLIQKLSAAENIDDALEDLYCVDGFDRFALGLMWTLRSPLLHVNGLQEELLEYEIDTLCSLVVEQQGQGSTRLPADRLGQRKDQESFQVILHRFGRLIGDLKRKLTLEGKYGGLEESMVSRILTEASALAGSAAMSSRIEVVEFSRGLSEFLQFVLDHQLLGDVRVLNILDSANLTLQTVAAAKGVEDADSLRQTTELLQHPDGLFQ